MNPPSLPSLYALYWHDRAVRFYINGMIFMVLLGVGIPWATTPVPGSPPLDPSSPEKLAAEWAPLVTPVIGVLMLGLLLLRRSFIRRTLSRCNRSRLRNNDFLGRHCIFSCFFPGIRLRRNGKNNGQNG